MEQQRLAYKDRWVELLTQSIEDDVDCFEMFKDLNEDSNLIVLDLSQEQFTRMYSALTVGADFAYPEKSHQIAIDFLRGLHCPIPFDTESDDCYNYPPYVPFIDWFPYNPHNESYIPSGYLSEPFVFGSAWVGYEDTDVIVPFDSIPLLATWHDLINGFLPQIAIQTTGDGQIEIDFLNILQGGFVVVKPQSPPNLLDIILGIFDPSIRIVDLQTDVSFPAESDLVVSEEYNVEVGAGNPHTLYCTWFPVLDDLIPPFGLPIRFGGGIRQVGLCGFESGGIVMGITDLRRNGENLEVFQDGQWTPKVDLDTWLQANPYSIQLRSDTDDNALEIQENADTIDAYYNELQIERLRIDSLEQVDIPQINLTLTDHSNRIIALEDLIALLQSNMEIAVTAYDLSVSGTQTTSSTVYVPVPNSVQEHTFTYPNALIIATCGLWNGNSAGYSYVRPTVDGASGANEQRNYGQSRKTAYVAQTFTDIEVGTPVDLELEYKTSAGHSAKVGSTQFNTYVVIEFAQDVSQILSDPIVTFDAGSAPYTDPPDNDGIVSSGGNPNNCMLKQSLTVGELVKISIDLGEVKQIDNVTWDMFVSDATPAIIWGVSVDGVSSCGQAENTASGLLNATWQSWSAIAGACGVSYLPRDGQVIEFWIQRSGGDQDDVRMDNIQVLTTDL